MIIVLSILVLLTLVVTFLTLSAVGNSLTALRADIAALFEETKFQSRVTRKVIVEKILPTIGYREPESAEEQLEQALRLFAQIDKSKVPSIDAAGNMGQ